MRPESYVIISILLIALFNINWYNLYLQVELVSLPLLIKSSVQLDKMFLDECCDLDETFCPCMNDKCRLILSSLAIHHFKDPRKSYDCVYSFMDGTVIVNYTGYKQKLLV